MMNRPGTYFFDTEGNRLGSDAELLPLPLVKDMRMTIHGQKGEFRVVEWSYHHGHGDENHGLSIVLDRVEARSVYEDRGIQMF